jgi:outer membrane protein assembly factor BamB
MCFDRADGSLLWQREVTYEKPEPTHDTNPYCSSSPVTDGERIIVWHGSAGAFAYDMEGELLWSRQLGDFQHVWGNASSPVIYNDLVILSCGPGLTAFVTALDKRTGEDKWRYDSPTSISEKLDEFRGSWSTPVVHRSGDRDELLLSLPLKFVALDPASGKELWRCEGPTKLAYTSPLAEGDTVVAMCGYGGNALAVKSGGSGNVTETHRLWLHDKGIPQRVGSGVIVDGHVYILNEPGIAWCIELATGEKKWENRLENENGTAAQSWSSMTHVDGKLYVTAMSGTTFVLEPTPEECRVIATNPIAELTRASLAFSDGQVFQRTYEHLYCIEE